MEQVYKLERVVVEVDRLELAEEVVEAADKLGRMVMLLNMLQLDRMEQALAEGIELKRHQLS